MKTTDRNLLAFDLAFLSVASFFFALAELAKDYVPATGLFLLAVLAVVATAQRLGKILEEPDNGLLGRTE